MKDEDELDNKVFKLMKKNINEGENSMESNKDNDNSRSS